MRRGVFRLGGGGSMWLDDAHPSGRREAGMTSCIDGTGRVGARVEVHRAEPLAHAGSTARSVVPSAVTGEQGTASRWAPPDG